MTGGLDVIFLKGFIVDDRITVDETILAYDQWKLETKDVLGGVQHVTSFKKPRRLQDTCQSIEYSACP